MEGNKDAYYQYMRQHYGEERIEQLQALKNIYRSFTTKELEVMEKRYKDMTEELLAGNISI